MIFLFGYTDLLKQAFFASNNFILEKTVLCDPTFFNVSKLGENMTSAYILINKPIETITNLNVVFYFNIH